MEVSTTASPPRANRIRAYLRLAYTELQYWFVGLTPEGYHAAQSAAWEELGDFKRAAKHVSAYLESTERPQMRALLGFLYSRDGRWSDAVREYTTAVAAWPHASVILGLAEARLQLGEFESAKSLADCIEFGETPLEPEVNEALAYFRARLNEATRQS